MLEHDAIQLLITFYIYSIALVVIQLLCTFYLYSICNYIEKLIEIKSITVCL
jgi:hypothetical protein